MFELNLLYEFENFFLFHIVNLKKFFDFFLNFFKHNGLVLSYWLNDHGDSQSLHLIFFDFYIKWYFHKANKIFELHFSEICAFLSHVTHFNFASENWHLRKKCFSTFITKTTTKTISQCLWVTSWRTCRSTTAKTSLSSTVGKAIRTADLPEVNTRSRPDIGRQSTFQPQIFQLNR